MDDDIHLPWDRQSLEALLRKVISTGETSKVDLKRDFGLSDAQHQAELLKDISAIANTYNHHYRNHGFLVFGVEHNSLVGCTFPNGEDHVQASVDDLIKKYLGQFIITHLFIFTDGGKQWGVLVVPPTRNAPHVFVNDIHKRYRGDVYVRSGTMTVKAQPEDYVRFFGQRLEEHTYEFQQTVSDLQRQVSALGAEVKKLKSAPASARGTKSKSEPEQSPNQAPDEPKSDKTISERINNLLARDEDRITKGVLEEAKKINDFLRSGEIPWAAQIANKEQTKELLDKIESVSGEFWTAVTSLVIRDDRGTYDETVIKAISHLARVMDAPSGTSYTELGRSIRYYPLLVALYLICIAGVAKKRDKLLKQVLKLELQGRSRYDEPLPITYVLFLIRRAADFFQPLHEGYPQQKWCDPIATYTKSLLDRLLNPDDPLWDKEAEFYRGEYLLCISPMDVLEKTTAKPMIGHPSSGIYLFISDAQPVITRFLKQDRDWLKKIFARPLDEILAEFDQTAHQLATSRGCWGGGFEGGALEAAFPDKVRKNTAAS